MSAHTPGPWVTQRKQFGPRCYAIVGADGDDVATTAPDAALPGLQIEANARLISAAPDGLAAARLALEWMHDPTDSGEWERIAEEFHRATGFTRPGKDVSPAAMEDEHRRINAWNDWTALRSRQVRVALEAFVAKAVKP